MTKPLNLDALERDWTEGNFDDELDAVRAAQRTIPILIDELRAARKVVAEIARGEVSGFELQQTAIRYLAGDKASQK